MRHGLRVSVIIPALNEERSIGHVLDVIPEWVDGIVVADNGSSDRTGAVATEHGARVVSEPRRGYGSACLAALKEMGPSDVVVFLDGDFSDYPEQMDRLVDPIAAGDADFVVGSRVLGRHERGALTIQARFGNWLATRLIRLFWRVHYTDLGPFRAVRRSTLESLHMADPDYGWTVEMQIKAAARAVRTHEVPVDYRKRIGKSKVSGTMRGVLGAGYKILKTIFAAALTGRRSSARTSNQRRLILFTRYPQPGSTKTRLIPALGEEGAADLQREMTQFTVNTVKSLQKNFVCDVEVRFEGADTARIADWLGEGIRYAPQGTGDLGGRMARAFSEAFAADTEAAVLIGTDCPDLSKDTLREAFDALDDCELVIGPARDGGYYLIGLNVSARDRTLPELFSQPAWGTASVLETTLATAERLGLRVHSLPELRDVDYPEDLPVWEDARKKRDDQRDWPCISVIIPAIDEAAYIGATIRAALSGQNVEVIVADGESCDATTGIASSLGAKVVPCERGRARQANAGAQAARGEFLLFLHADTVLPPGWDGHVRKTLAQNGPIAGAFAFAVDMKGISMRLFTMVANFRATRLQMPYGDQALFLRRSTFEELERFPELPIMDDFEMVRRLRRIGRIHILPIPATSSGRRWRRIGVWRTMLTNQVCVIGYLLGVPPARIARWYNRRRGLTQ